MFSTVEPEIHQQASSLLLSMSDDFQKAFFEGVSLDDFGKVIGGDDLPWSKDNEVSYMYTCIVFDYSHKLHRNYKRLKILQEGICSSLRKNKNPGLKRSGENTSCRNISFYVLDKTPM